MARRSMASRSALFGASLATAVVGAALPAHAFDDGYQNVFSSVLTAVGVLSPEKSPEIEYRERAPLVLPPKSGLAKPAPAVARPASWPQDPDVVRRRREAEEAKTPEVFRFTRSGDGAPLSKEEMMKGRAAAVNEADLTPTGCNGSKRNEGHCLLLSPDELKEQGERFRASNPEKQEVVAVGVEPERDYLTQPPRGYMKATKAVKATTEAPEPKIDQSNPASQLVYRQKENQ